MSPHRLRLLGLGDNVVDDYLHERVMYPGGNALNFAVYARQLGHDAAYLGLFGNDAAGRHVQSVAAHRGLDLSHCQELDGPNGHAELTVVRGDRVFLGSNRGGVRENAPMDFVFDDTAYLTGFNLIHTSLYSYVDAILPRLARLGTPLSYDFSDDFEEGAALGLCRYLAFAFFSCAEQSEQATRVLLKSAVAAGCGIAVATRGSAGALAFDGAHWLTQLPHLVTPVDTMGAGDAFITAFLARHCLASQPERESGAALAPALDAGARFAASICLVRGAFGEGLAY